MNGQENHLRTAELSTEQNANMLDGILNNAPLPEPEEKPLDKVKERPPRKGGREREER